MNVVVIWPHCSVLLLFCEVYWHVETTKVVCGCMISNLFCAAIAQLESGHSRKFVFSFYVLYLRSAREWGWWGSHGNRDRCCGNTAWAETAAAGIPGICLCGNPTGTLWNIANNKNSGVSVRILSKMLCEMSYVAAKCVVVVDSSWSSVVVLLQKRRWCYHTG